MTSFAAARRDLGEILSYRRPAGSKTERRFIRDWLEPLDVRRDGYGNRFKLIAQKHGQPLPLWSCHTDTVHRTPGMQTTIAETLKGNVYMGTVDVASNCLGADDGAGLWVMIEMIKAKVPGMYVFHREEEIGGKGSAWIRANNPGLLQNVQLAVAFDRKDMYSIITRQRGKCCSDEFARSLGVALGDASKGLLTYKPDSTGLFTDTANYTGLVGECTNLSVGYYGAHGPEEYVNLSFLIALRDAMLKLNIENLAYTRKAGEAEYSSAAEANSGRAGHWRGNNYYNRGGDSLWDAEGSENNRMGHNSQPPYYDSERLKKRDTQFKVGWRWHDEWGYVDTRGPGGYDGGVARAAAAWAANQSKSASATVITMPAPRPNNAVLMPSTMLRAPAKEGETLTQAEAAAQAYFVDQGWHFDKLTDAWWRPGSSQEMTKTQAYALWQHRKLTDAKGEVKPSAPQSNLPINVLPPERPKATNLLDPVAAQELAFKRRREANDLADAIEKHAHIAAKLLIECGYDATTFYIEVQAARDDI